MRSCFATFHEKAVKLFLKFISHYFAGGGIVLPSGLSMSVHVLIRSFRKGWNVAILFSKSHNLSFRRCIAIVPNRPSSVGSRVPPNACRGERCGLAPIRPLQAMVGKDS